MKVLLCGIAKCENHYIREWVEWYKNIGVDHICLYDNNDLNGEKFEEVISYYIDSGFVEIIDYRSKINCQLSAYTECYNNNKDYYDWLLFLDIDELLELECGSIKSFLSDKKYKNFNGIRVWWRVFDDNGLVKVENNDYSMYSRFTHPALEHKDNHLTKVIVRGKQNNIEYIDSPHYPNNLTNVCNTLGEPMKLEDWFPKGKCILDFAIINHYRCKTIEEYIKNKMQRLWANLSKEWAEKTLTLDYFFRRNKKTKEKEEFANKLLSILNGKHYKDLDIKNNIDILYIIGKGSKWNNNELKYSLRCLAKNGYNINRIFIVGDIPKFVNRKTVLCIPLEDPSNIKHYNMLYKIDYVINNTDIGCKNDGKFLVSSDDHFYIKPTNFDQYPVYYTGDLPFKYTEQNECGYKEWLNSLIDTRLLLLENNLSCLKFNWHGNTWFNSTLWNSSEFKMLRDKSLQLLFGVEPTALMINYWISKELFTPKIKTDCKFKNNITKNKFHDKIQNREVFSCYPNIKNSYPAKWLEKNYPDKCKYEV